MNQEFLDLVQKEYEVEARPVIKAEWNWNLTSYLSNNNDYGDVDTELLDNGSIMNFYYYDSNNVTSASEFRNVFRESQFINQVDHPYSSWTETYQNAPLGLAYRFGIKQIYYIRINQAGQWEFNVSAKDSYELYIDGQLVGSHYGYGSAPVPPTYEDQYLVSFGSSGDYLVEVRLFAEGPDYAFYLGYRSPLMISNSDSVQELPSSMLVRPPAQITQGPQENPELMVQNKETWLLKSSVQEWLPYKEFYQLSSITGEHRPKSGINYNYLTVFNDQAYVMDSTHFIEYKGTPRRRRYYNLNLQNPAYQYWISPTTSSVTSNGSGYYDIDDVDIILKYDESVSSNKVSITFNLGAVPTDITVQYLDENMVWRDIFNSTSQPGTIQNDGVLEFYRVSDNDISINNDADNWLEVDRTSISSVAQIEQSLESDFSVPMQKIRLIVNSLHLPARRCELIEFAAKKEIRITDRVVAFSSDLNMEELDFMRILGSISANSGSIEISNYDNAFQNADDDSKPKLAQIEDKKTKFIFGLEYDLERFGYPDRWYPVSIGTFYSSNWNRNGEFDYTITLFDAAKHLQNVDCPEIYEKNIAVHELVAQILDSVGFGDYRIDLEDYSKTANVLEYFATSSDVESVWDILRRVCDSMMCSIFFDQDGILQLATKEFITSGPDIKVIPTDFEVNSNVYVNDQNSIYYGLSDESYSLGVYFTPNPEAVSENFNDGYYVNGSLYWYNRKSGPQYRGSWEVFDLKEFRGQRDELEATPLDPFSDPDKLPNIINLQKAYDVEANDVEISYRPKRIKTSGDPADDIPLTDIVWQPEDTIVLRATRLAFSIQPWEQMYFYIFPDDAVEFPYAGRANINGEIIAWSGKEYEYYERVVLPNGLSYTKPPQKRMVYAHDELIKLQKLSGSNQITQSRNRFTGKIQLLRDDPRSQINAPGFGPSTIPIGIYAEYDPAKKVNRPIGRGRDQDPSKYETLHLDSKRLGWNHYRMNLGEPGAQLGYWPGESRTSFYNPNNVDRTSTTLETNRPHNGNSNWFKNQCLIRSEPIGKNIQKLGFRMKFKESKTIGELNLMFNMTAVPLVGAWRDAVYSTHPSQVNQFYQISFLETQNIVRDHSHEIGAWVQTPYAFDGSNDIKFCRYNQRLSNRNYWESRSERTKGYRFEFLRDTWYDIQVDITRGRGYSANHDMHFFVWVNGQPVGGFTTFNTSSIHPFTRFLPLSNTWGIGHRAASNVEIENAWSWTEFTTPQADEEYAKWDMTNNGYLSSYLDEGLLLPRAGAPKPYRSTTRMSGYFFFDDFGSVLKEIRDFEVDFDRSPVDGLTAYFSNEDVRLLNMSYSPSKAKFSIVNTGSSTTIVHGEEALPDGNSVNHKMVLFGYVLEELEQESISVQNEDAIRDRGREKLDIDADWITSKEQALELADWVNRHFSDPKDLIEVEFFADASIKLGDKVTIRYEKADIDKRWIYIVQGLSYSYSSNGLECSATLRRVRNNPVDNDNSLVTIDPSQPEVQEPIEYAEFIKTLTGSGVTTQWDVNGTDLGIPFILENGSVGYLFGDTFSTAMPSGTNWRSPVGLRSNPGAYPINNGIIFDSAYRVAGENPAPELMFNAHDTSGNPGAEYTVIPNDGIAFPETGRQLVSYMSVNNWDNGTWRTNYTGLAFSDNGNDFIRLDDVKWYNNELGDDPWQMWTMQRYGNYVYIFSTANGRDLEAGVHLRRVHWARMFFKNEYESWNGQSWSRWGTTKPIINGRFSELSVRKLGNTWVMAYLDPVSLNIVTRRASSPIGPWSGPKIQLTSTIEPNLYGGFIHPYSTPDNLHMMVSVWTASEYAVKQYKGQA